MTGRFEFWVWISAPLFCRSWLGIVHTGKPQQAETAWVELPQLGGTVTSVNGNSLLCACY